MDIPVTGHEYIPLLILIFPLLDIVGCLKIIKDKSAKAESQTPDAGLISASTAHQGAWVETRVSAAPRRVGRNPRLSCNRPGYRVNHGLHNGES